MFPACFHSASQVCRILYRYTSRLIMPAHGNSLRGCRSNPFFRFAAISLAGIASVSFACFAEADIREQTL